MLNNLKALIVVAGLAAVVFVLAKPACLRFMSEADFRRRRTVWFIVTVAAFASPEFWFYALIAVPVAIWAGRKDSNPAALYLLLLAAAPVVRVPLPGILDLNQSRLLVLCVVIPALFRRDYTQGQLPPHPREIRRIRSMDVLLVAFCTLMVAPYWQVESWTSVLRRETVAILDIVLPYLLFSRSLRSHRSIVEVMAVFTLSCAIMVPIAVFESLKGWLLYVTVADYWGVNANSFTYLHRAGTLRAMVTADHPLILGFVMALAFGFCLYLRKYVTSRVTFTVAASLMWVGLLAAYSRGPWVVAVLIMFAYLLLLPRGASRAIKAACLAGLLAAVLLQTPYGQRIAESLPFVGHVDAYNVEYRQRLFDRAMELIPLHPWFGDIFVERNMESLRQGQGIIDLVNGYLYLALYFGLVPLAILVCFLSIALGRAYQASRRFGHQDPDVSALGSILIASLVGAMLFIWVARFSLEVWMLAGLAVAYAGLLEQKPVTRTLATRWHLASRRNAPS